MNLHNWDWLEIQQNSLIEHTRKTALEGLNLLENPLRLSSIMAYIAHQNIVKHISYSIHDFCKKGWFFHLILHSDILLNKFLILPYSIFISMLVDIQDFVDS